MIIGSQQELLDFVASDIKKNEGISFPLKASHVERFLIRKLPVGVLHPNPDDEFSIPEVGPSFRIINDYRELMRQHRWECKKLIDERLVVEKMAPSGYLIINGHHRWSAAMLERVGWVPVEIVNLTHNEDLHHMLDQTTRNKRVAFDLDEVIFATDKQEMVEKTAARFRCLFYSEKIKVGRAALVNALHKMGYDVWVYTRGYHSTDYIEKLFDCYNFKVDGIINGVGDMRDYKHDESIREKIERKYLLSLHIDNEQVTFIDKKTREFVKHPIEGEKNEWSRQVLAIINSIEGEYGCD